MYNKFSLLGVYSSNILVPSWGSAIKLALYVEIYAQDIGQKIVGIMAIYDGEIVLKGEMDADFNDPALPAILATPAFGVQLNRPSNLVVRLECDDMSHRILNIPVELAPSAMFPDASALPQLSSRSPTDAPEKASARVTRRRAARPADGES